jgi:hypothetical protein
MEMAHKNSSRGNSSSIFTVSLFLMVALFFIASCTHRPKPYSIVEFVGNDMVSNYSKTYILSEYKVDSNYVNSLIAEKGDLIVTDKGNLFVFNDLSQNKYTIKSTKQAAYLNGKLSSIIIPGNDSLLPWLEQLKESDLKTIEFLNFNSGISDKYFPFFNRLAKIKPDIGIGYSGEFKDMQGLLKIFKPKILVGGSYSSKDYDLLSGLTRLEYLSINLNDSIYPGPLPALPDLKALFLGEINRHLDLMEFLVNNKQIEKLNIMSYVKFDLSLLKPLINLKQLVVSNFDTVENLLMINDHKKLEELTLTGEDFRYGEEINDLPKLRWITFSTSGTQGDLNSVVEHHPDIEVVEFMKNDTIKSFEPLLKLKKLYGLSVYFNLTDFETLKSLKTLKYLSLPDEVLNDTIKKAELQKALPGTKLVATHGVCLGSGWLLLLVPFVLLFSFLARMNMRKAHR